MEIKEKLYPYPVLSSFSNGYINSSFDVDISAAIDGYDLRLDFTANLDCASLATEIENGNANFVYHLECPQTGFRKVVQTNQSCISHTLMSKSVNGKIQVCPFIVAIKDIPEYISTEFHADYSGICFNIEAGCVMAVAKMAVIDVNKDTDELANTPSIFKVSKNPDQNCRQMLVDLAQRKIQIKLPAADFNAFKALNSSPLAQPILNSLVVFPALAYTLEHLRAMSIYDRSEQSDCIWYKTLKKTLSTKFNCNIESDEFSEINSIELSQKLLNSPISEAFVFLTEKFTDSGDDES